MKFVVEHYEFGRYCRGLDEYFKNEKQAEEYVRKQREFNRKEKLVGFSYKIMIEE